MCYTVLTINPFAPVLELLKPSNSSNVFKFFALTGLLAFIAILWQVIPLMLNSDNEKLVAQKKSNIKKILIAFAILISIEAILAGIGSMSRLMWGSGGSNGNGINGNTGTNKNITITEMQ